MSDPYKELHDVILNWHQQTQADELKIAVRDPHSNKIVFNTGSTEMLRVTPEGFYVRGVRVEQDAREAEIVYNNFRQWLTWAQLNRD